MLTAVEGQLEDIRAALASYTPIEDAGGRAGQAGRGGAGAQATSLRAAELCFSAPEPRGPPLGAGVTDAFPSTMAAELEVLEARFAEAKQLQARCGEPHAVLRAGRWAQHLTSAARHPCGSAA